MTENATAKRIGDEVDRDVACLGCAYNLRGLSPEGNCPECGWAVMRSLRGNLLRYAEARWVARVRRGLFLVYACILGVLLVFLAAALTIPLMMAFGGMGGPITGNVVFAACLILWAAPVIYAVGWWLATAPDPGEEPEAAWERRAIRVTAVLFLPALAGWQLPSVLPWAWSVSPVAVEAITHVCFVTIWFHLVKMTGVLDRLYRRTAPTDALDERRNREKLSRAVRWALRAPVVFLAIHWLYGLAEIVIIKRGAAPPAIGAGGIGTGLGSGVGPFLISVLWLSTIDACLIVGRAVKNEQLVAAASDGQDASAQDALSD